VDFVCTSCSSFVAYPLVMLLGICKIDGFETPSSSSFCKHSRKMDINCNHCPYMRFESHSLNADPYPLTIVYSRQIKWRP
jgi:hypothetical protein